ncbi:MULTISPECIES: MFS transporter [Nocardia]|uniref:MFS transporter n=1 Tax=Nocardia TaxID=1817 RepID=UPI000D68DB52|nr:MULTISPECIES: MFS transporter [Nocardia]
MRSTSENDAVTDDFVGFSTRVVVVGISSVAVFVAAADAVVLSLPGAALAHDLSAPVHQVSWAVTAYAVAFLAWLAVAVAVVARQGIQPSLVTGLMGFAIASGVCALASTNPVLIGARAAQGMTAALLVAAATAAVSSTRPAPSPKHTATILAGAAVVAAVIGPAAGAVVVDSLGWRALFAVNVPVCIVLSVVAVAVLPDPRQNWSAPRPDYRGGLLLSGAITAVVAAASGARQWPGPLSWLILLIGLSALGVAVLRTIPATTQSGPGPRWLFQAVAVASPVTFVAGLAGFGYLLAASLLMTGPGHVNWLDAAGCGGAVSATAILASFPASRHPRSSSLIVAGFTGLAAAAAGLTLVYPEIVGTAPQWWAWTVSVVLIGVGIGASATTLAMLADLVPATDDPESGVRTGVVGQICGAAGAAGLGAALTCADLLDLTFPFWAILAATLATAGVVIALIPVPGPARITAAAGEGTP